MMASSGLAAVTPGLIVSLLHADTNSIKAKPIKRTIRFISLYLIELRLYFLNNWSKLLDMPRLLLIAVLMIPFCVSLHGQEKSISGCPTISVFSSMRIPNPGEPRIFTAEVNTAGRQFD